MVKTVTVAALLLAAPLAQAEAPLAPNGKWAVEHADNLCVLRHTYSDVTAPQLLEIAPLPLGEQSDMLFIATGNAKTPRGGKATITVDSSNTSLNAELVEARQPKGGRGVVRLRMVGDVSALVTDATTMTITLPGSTTSLPLPSFKPAITALRACQDDLLRKWGIDPSERTIRADRKAVNLAVIAQRVGGGANDRDPPAAKVGNDPAGWITSDDYPVEALMGEKQGNVLLVWTIGVDGHVQDCRVLASSGEPSLDRASCRAISARARYSTVNDKDGQPAITHALGRVAWRIPQ